MEFLDAIAGIFWAWWHGGEGMSRETVRNNPWASHRDLGTALQEYNSVLHTQIEPQQPKRVRGQEDLKVLAHNVTTVDFVSFSHDPASARELFYQAINTNIMVDKHIPIFEFSYHMQLFSLYLLMFSLSCFACNHPGEPVPLTEEDIYTIREQIQDRLNGFWDPEQVGIGDFAYRIAKLTPEGQKLTQYLMEKRDCLPPLNSLPELLPEEDQQPAT